jgi:inner membrane transporter RhtA
VAVGSDPIASTRGLGRVPPVALVLAAIGSVQTGASLAITIFDDVGAAATAFLRVAIAAVILGALVRPTLRGRSWHDLRLAIAFGLLLGGMNTCFYLALDRIPQGIAVTVEFVGPLGVALAMSRRALDLVWIALAGAGIGLLSGGGIEHADPVGLGFALAAGCLWGAYILVGARLVRSFPGMSGLTIAMAVAGVAMLPGGIASGDGALGDPAVLGVAAAVAVLSSVIPYTCELEALRRMPPRVFGVLMSLEPAVAAIMGFAILGQDLSALEGLAIGLVVVASAGVALTARSTVEPSDVPAALAGPER